MHESFVLQLFNLRGHCCKDMWGCFWQICNFSHFHFFSSMSTIACKFLIFPHTRAQMSRRTDSRRASRKEWKSWWKVITHFQMCNTEREKRMSTIRRARWKKEKCENSALFLWDVKSNFCHTSPSLTRRRKNFSHGKKGKKGKFECLPSGKGAPAVGQDVLSSARAFPKFSHIVLRAARGAEKSFQVGEEGKKMWEKSGIVNRFQLINGFIFSLKIDFNRFFWFKSSRCGVCCCAAGLTWKSQLWKANNSFISMPKLHREPTSVKSGTE